MGLFLVKNIKNLKAIPYFMLPIEKVLHLKDQEMAFVRRSRLKTIEMRVSAQNKYHLH